MRIGALVMAATLLIASAGGAARQADQASVLLEAARKKEVVDGDLRAAIQQYREIATRFNASRTVAATALMRIAECHQKLGELQARDAYEQLLREYPDQKQLAATARARLASMGTAIVEPRDPAPTMRQAWSGDHTAVGTPSPDGQWLPLNDHGRLVLHNMVNGSTRRFSDDRGYATAIAMFTPDGRRVLYRWQEEKTDDWLIKIKDLDGRNERILHRTPYSAASPQPRFRAPIPTAISLDGLHAAVTANDNTVPVVGILNLQTGAITVVQRFTWEAVALGNFSADGRYIVYAVGVDRNSADREIRVVAVDGSQTSTVVAASTARTARTPRFTPDGSQVTFISNRVPGRLDLWGVRVAHGQAAGVPELIMPSIGDAIGLGFSRDGTYFFKTIVFNEDGYVVDVNPTTGHVTGTPTRVSEKYVHHTMAPLWSPDGKSLAYVAAQEGRTARAPGAVMIVVRDLMTGVERAYPLSVSIRFAAGFYRWFPDGKSLLIPDAGEQSRLFWQLELATGRVTKLFETGQGVGSRYRTWMEPDGRAIYYNAGAPGQLQWVRRDLATGDERSVITVNATSVNPSPDGRYLTVMEKNAGPIFLADLITGAVRPWWAPKNVAFEGGGAGWSPDSRGCYTSLAAWGLSERVVNAEREPQELWYMPVDGEPRKSGLRMQNMFNLYVRPDGRQLGFSGRTTTGYVWSLPRLVPPARPVTTSTAR